MDGRAIDEAPRNVVLLGDCIERLRELPDNSVDAIVTDPPYGLEFMGKAWDGFDTAHAFGEWCRQWAIEALRVLKPGGHILAFGGTRTYHRLVSGLEDAGFEIRDTIAWLYGSGFPKSLDVSKAIDKQRDDREDHGRVARWLVDRMEEAGVSRRDVSEHFGYANGAQQWTTWWTDKAVKPRVPTWDQWTELRRWLGFGPEMDAEVWRLNGRKGQPGEAWFEREVVGEKTAGMGSGNTFGMLQAEGDNANADKIVPITAPATDAARTWSGFGTALKPAHEPIVVARKPLAGTVAANVERYGTGALNIDGCRVEGVMDGTWGATQRGSLGYHFKTEGSGFQTEPSPLGRWPANVAHDGSVEVLELFPQEREASAARFFYCAKASRADREAGLDGLPANGQRVMNSGSSGRTMVDGEWVETHSEPRTRANDHPTVKPHDLMRWLVRLVGGQPGSLILDPFAGSGSTLRAARAEGFDFLGIERDPHYYRLACLRAGLPDPGEQAA